MNWDKLINSTIEVDGVKMIVYNYCKSCKRILATDEHKYYRVRVDKFDGLNIISERLKPLE